MYEYIRNSFVFLFIFSCSFSILAGEMQTWQGANGKTIKAQFIDYDGQIVRLRMADGLVKRVSISRFSDKDQKTIRRYEKLDNPFDAEEIKNGSESNIKTKANSTNSRPNELLDPNEKKTYFKVHGNKILDPDGKQIRLRGVNVLEWNAVSQKDARDLKEIGIQVIQFVFMWNYETNEAHSDKEIQRIKRTVKILKENINKYTDEGIYVIPFLHCMAWKGDGEDHRLLKKGMEVKEPHNKPWNNSNSYELFIEIWKNIIKELGDNPMILAWEIGDEPMLQHDRTLGIFYNRVIPELRKYDPNRPFIVPGNIFNKNKALTSDLLVKDKNIIYAFTSFHPLQYTLAEFRKGRNIAYPNPDLNINHLMDVLLYQRAFSSKYNVPVICAGWGVEYDSINNKRWINDMGIVLETLEINWMFWNWDRRKIENDSDMKLHLERFNLIADIIKNPKKYKKKLPR